MVYVTKDAGSAVGQIISAIAEVKNIDSVNVTIRQDEMSVSISVSDSVRKVSHATSADRPAKARVSKSIKASRSGKKGKSNLFEFNGVSLTAKEWADKVGISRNALYRRISEYGNPYGKKGAELDKIIIA